MTDGPVLITGATGFIAGHCVAELLASGYPVRGTVRHLQTADVRHLQRIAAETGGSFEIVETSLDSDDGWDAAMDGCRAVWHVAAPVPASIPKDPQELIRPAVDGTGRVMRAAAASGTVRRVVMTSSTDAVCGGRHDASRVWTEDDWADERTAGPYPTSKLLSERAAIRLADEHGLELVRINPSLVLGPLLHAEQPTSLESIRKLMARELPAVPHLDYPIVDARDVAAAHRLAMEHPDSAGQRYIIAGEHRWMGELAAMLAERFNPRGYRIPTRRLPYAAMWLIARFDGTIRLALNYVGLRHEMSTAKARAELGWSPRPVTDTVLEAAESLEHFGVVKPTRR